MKLKLEIHHPFTMKKAYDVFFKWEGLIGYRRLSIERTDMGFSLSRAGVEDIKKLCEEFLDGYDRTNQYLSIE
jgi:hypothetical protein